VRSRVPRPIPPEYPALGQLYFTENSRDWLSEDVLEDKLNRLTQPGKDNFGYP
jgi:glucose/arabinose dehydrogenase